MTAPHGEAQQGPAGDQRLDVVVVGGSQAGLAMAWHLAQQGRRFVVLEAAPELGYTWRSRWDSLKLFTPAQYDALPGMAFPAPADTYPTKDPVADYLQAYAKAFDLPVQLNAKATELRRLDDGSFEVHTADATYQARQVVVATGPFQVPFMPPPAAKLDTSVTQLHSADYHNPQALPEGPVLVVGGGNSGFQIAEELAATRPGRPVDRHHLSDAAPAAGRQGPVLVADPPGPAAGHGHLPGRPADEPPGLRDRDQPEEAGAGRGAVPAAAGRRRGPHGPLRRP
jgi:hypothetical protein